MTSLTSPEKWEGRVIDGKFPLQQWLGSSEHAAVFLTERSANGSQKAAIKLISADVFSPGNINEASQLSRWAATAKLSHPNLIRLFEGGRVQIDGSHFLYVVMEYAEENLAQILPERPLSPAEVGEMLPPVAEALALLHQNGFAHGHIKPSNILAIDNQLKISTDSLRRFGERDPQTPSIYLAPELPSTGASSPADVWSLGVMLVAIMTQHEPSFTSVGRGIVIPKAFPQPFYGIAEHCLRIDPTQRWSVNKILGRPDLPEPLPAKPSERPAAPVKPSKKWLILPIVAAVILLAVFLGRRSHQPDVPPAQTHPTESSTPNAPAAQSPAPFNNFLKPRQTGLTRGRVLQQILPDVSQSARNTITGRVKISIQVSVNPSGNVSQARLVSPGPSRYFANQALTASRRWKFAPAQVNGQPASAEWILRFQVGRTSTQVFPTETKP